MSQNAKEKEEEPSHPYYCPQNTNNYNGKVGTLPTLHVHIGSEVVAPFDFLAAKVKRGILEGLEGSAGEQGKKEEPEGEQ